MGGEVIMNKVSIKTSGIKCNHCVKKVENAIKTLNGIDTVAIDLSTGMVNVTYNSLEVNQKEILNAIEVSGYKVEQVYDEKRV